MIRQCFLANTGIQFYCETFKHIGLDPATLFPTSPLQWPSAGFAGSVVHFQIGRARGTIGRPESLNDQLESWFSPWRILEFVPFLQSEQNRKDFPLSYDRWYDFSPPFPPSVTHVGVIFLLRLNMGHGRHIPEPVRDSERKEKVLVHRSVKTKMDAECLKGGESINPRRASKTMRLNGWNEARAVKLQVPRIPFPFLFKGPALLLVLF
jgi:hypothetical protein